MNYINNLIVVVATSISWFDFSTLYTTTPHEKLIKVLFEIRDFCFKVGDKQFITVGIKVGKNGASKQQKIRIYNSFMIFTEKRCEILWITVSFQRGNKMFIKIIGIPMRSDPERIFANLLYYYYESK